MKKSEETIIIDKMYRELAEKSLRTGSIDDKDIEWIAGGKDVELLPLLYASYKVRYKYFGNKVKIHILNNVRSGACVEDCRYCAQSISSKNPDAVHPAKSRKEILKEAAAAYKNGAYRYCMVFSGIRQTKKNIKEICSVICEIKRKYPMEVCVSAGFIDEVTAAEFKAAGLNRYNHNINTSREYYSKICTTHDYRERLKSIKTAYNAGLDICSGIIIGMGETVKDITSIMKELKKIKVKSIPVNFFIPVKGHRIKKIKPLTPEYCLRILALFRFVFPETEIRTAGGREYHLRSLQHLCLYPSNSLFAEGYLTTGGDDIKTTVNMIRDTGFEIERASF